MKSNADNPRWCCNPQYFLNLEKPSHLKIVLRKSLRCRRQLKNTFIGMTICRAPKTEQEIKYTNVSKRKLQLQQTQDLTKLSAPKLEILERKLQISCNEWVCDSPWGDDKTSTL